MFTPNGVWWKFAKYLLAVGCVYVVSKSAIKTHSNKPQNHPSVKSPQSQDEPEPHQNIRGEVNDSIKYYKSEMYDSAPFIWNNELICHPNESQDQGRLSGQRKKLTIIINSSRSNFHRRQLIRQTFGSISNVKNWTIIPPVFLVGQTNQKESPWISRTIELEHKNFNDLIKKDFIDSYRNLTLKSIMGFEWVHKYCHDATIVIKMDDDVVLNIFQLIKILDENPEITVSSNFYCNVELPNKEMPHRVKGHQWYVSYESYPDKFFPPYCSGLGIVTTVKTIDRILDQVDLDKVENVLPIDDAYLTGVIPHKINEKLRSLNASTENIKRIDQNKKWYHFIAREMIPNYLRDWYQNPEVFGLNHKIFYLVPHFENYFNDFVGTWEKIKLTEGQT